MKTITLYRPVGAKELELIKSMDYKKFPPRLPEQHNLYSVLNKDYVMEIAKEWNIKASAFCCVTKFAIKSDYIAKYEIQTVGSLISQEYWIPAKELEEFNQNIVAPIEVIAEFHSNI
ncbi:MAG: hypothetical protein AAF383_15010 [Cyanobacteria bacterium P01_A01_bin.83]